MGTLGSVRPLDPGLRPAPPQPARPASSIILTVPRVRTVPEIFFRPATLGTLGTARKFPAAGHPVPRVPHRTHLTCFPKCGQFFLHLELPKTHMDIHFGNNFGNSDSNMGFEEISTNLDHPRNKKSNPPAGFVFEQCLSFAKI